MTCNLLGIDWCFIGKSLFFNWFTIAGVLITIPITIYVKYRWQIRAWKVKKFNPKHTLTAIFLNKEGCISILPMAIKEQRKFEYEKESYLIDKEAIFHAFHGKKWFWQTKSTGEPYSIYIDGIPQPIKKAFLLSRGKDGLKFDAKVINELANQKFLSELLTDTSMNMKQLLIIAGCIGIGIAIMYFVNKGGV